MTRRRADGAGTSRALYRTGAQLWRVSAGCGNDRRAAGVLRKRLASESVYETINRKANRRLMRVADKSMAGASDGAQVEQACADPQPAQLATVQFDGIVFADTTATSARLPAAADTTGAVGPKLLRAGGQSAFRVWDRTGTATATIPFSTLFGTLSGACRICE